MSKDTLSVTDKRDVSINDPFSADPKIVSKMDVVVDALSRVTIDNLKGLFAIAAQNANDCRSIFTECAELYRKKYLTQAEDIRDVQSRKWSHGVNIAGAIVPACFGKQKIAGKAIGGAITAMGSTLSASQQSDGTYKSAQKDGLSQMMQNAYGDTSRAQQEIDKVLQNKGQAESALQQAKAAMMR